MPNLNSLGFHEAPVDPELSNLYLHCSWRWECMCDVYGVCMMCVHAWIRGMCDVYGVCMICVHAWIRYSKDLNTYIPFTIILYTA